MVLWKLIAQAWILIPVVLLMVSGLALTLRSVDVRAGAMGGARQLASNLTSTVLGLALCLILMMFAQSIVGFNLGSL